MQSREKGSYQKMVSCFFLCPDADCSRINLLNKLNIPFTVVMPRDGDEEVFNMMENRARRHYEADEFDHSIIRAVAPRAEILDIDMEHPYLTDVLE